MICNLNQTLPIILTNTFPKEVKHNYDAIVQDVIGIIQNLIPGKPPAGIKPIYCRAWNGPTPLTQTYQNYYLISLKIEPEKLLYCKFVYQLGHELGHVMLGSKRTNGMVETLATLISYQILDEMAKKWLVDPPYSNWLYYSPEFINYRNGDKSKHAAYLGLEVQKMVEKEDWVNLSAFMKSHVEEQDTNLISERNRALNCMGVLLLRTQSINWPKLNGLAWLTNPSPIDDPDYRDDLDIVSYKVPSEVLPLFEILGRV